MGPLEKHRAPLGQKRRDQKSSTASWWASPHQSFDTKRRHIPRMPVHRWPLVDPSKKPRQSCEASWPWSSKNQEETDGKASARHRLAILPRLEGLARRGYPDRGQWWLWKAVDWEYFWQPERKVDIPWSRSWKWEVSVPLHRRLTGYQARRYRLWKGQCDLQNWYFTLWALARDRFYRKKFVVKRCH